MKIHFMEDGGRYSLCGFHFNTIPFHKPHREVTADNLKDPANYCVICIRKENELRKAKRPLEGTK